MQPVPLDFLGELRRTHSCGELRAADAGRRAILMGWVHRRRDLGGVIFIHLRDREGVTQLVFHADTNPELHAKVALLSSEYVIAVEGLVALRSADTVNPALPTGEVELVAEQLWILNESRTPPFPMEENVDVKEDARLKYRYVDLRRPQMQRNIILRFEDRFRGSRDAHPPGFSRNRNADYHAGNAGRRARLSWSPARVNPGQCSYALPQSPQIFKQLLIGQRASRQVFSNRALLPR